MGELDPTFLERQQAKLQAQAGEMLDELMEDPEGTDEEEFIKGAKALLAQYDRQQAALIQIQEQNNDQK